MARGLVAFFYGFTGIINHRFLTNQFARTIRSYFINMQRYTETQPCLLLLASYFDPI